VIERYLPELHRLLGRGPGRGRLLAEVEDHLREAAQRLEREGTSPTDAETLVTTWVALLGVSALAAAAWSLRRSFSLTRA
jgi:hypothetical protein